MKVRTEVLEWMSLTYPQMNMDKRGPPDPYKNKNVSKMELKLMVLSVKEGNQWRRLRKELNDSHSYLCVTPLILALFSVTHEISPLTSDLWSETATTEIPEPHSLTLSVPPLFTHYLTLFQAYSLADFNY